MNSATVAASARFLVLVFLAFAAGGGGAWAQTPLTAARCDADRLILMNDIEKNRETSLKYYDDAIAEIINPEARDHLAIERQQVFDREEEQRQTAYTIWRDCMAYVKKSKETKAE